MDIPPQNTSLLSLIGEDSDEEPTTNNATLNTTLGSMGSLVGYGADGVLECILALCTLAHPLRRSVEERE